MDKNISQSRPHTGPGILQWALHYGIATSPGVPNLYGTGRGVALAMEGGNVYAVPENSTLEISNQKLVVKNDKGEVTIRVPVLMLRAIGYDIESAKTAARKAACVIH